MKEKINERTTIKHQTVPEYQAYVMGMLDMAECFALSHEMRMNLNAEMSVPQLEPARS